MCERIGMGLVMIGLYALADIVWLMSHMGALNGY